MAGKLRVIEIFDSLQGEGWWAGVPMSFVRLAGCNAPELGLECLRWCDTRAAWDPSAGEVFSISEVLGQARLPRICVTGGEPLLQKQALNKLIREAHRHGQKVHLETNGTLEPPELACDWVVVSPKPPDYFLSPGWEGRVNELKLIADERLDASVAEQLAAAYPRAVVCIQPLSPPHKKTPAPDSVERALALVRSHPDWRLSLQIHKLLGLR